MPRKRSIVGAEVIFVGQNLIRSLSSGIAAKAVLGLLIGSVAFAADSDGGLRAFRQGDYNAAIRIWKADADKGDKNAQYNLGFLYMNGVGVNKDLDEAIRLFQLAAGQGHPQAEF